MNRLLEFIKKYNYWFLFVLLEIIGIIMLFRFNNYQASVYLTSANAVSGKLYDMSSAVTLYADVKEQNRELTRQNILLERQVAQLRLKLEKINGDKEHVDSKEKAMASLDGYTLLDAQVINATTSKVRNYLTINKGYKDGVKPEMGVVGGRGVIGIVYLTSAHYSLVIPLLNEPKLPHPRPRIFRYAFVERRKHSDGMAQRYSAPRPIQGWRLCGYQRFLFGLSRRNVCR